MNLSQKTDAMRVCIDKGHDMAYDSHECFRGWAGCPLIEITWVCKRCGYTTTGWATSKEKRAIKVLGL